MIINKIKKALNYAQRYHILTSIDISEYKRLLSKLKYTDLYLNPSDKKYDAIYNIINITDSYYHQIAKLSIVAIMVSMVLQLVPLGVIYHLIVLAFSIPALILFMKYDSFSTRSELKKYLYNHSPDKITIPQNASLEPVEEQLQEIYDMLNKYDNNPEVNAVKKNILGLAEVIKTRKAIEKKKLEEQEIAKLACDVKGLKQYVDMNAPKTTPITNKNAPMPDTPENEIVCKPMLTLPEAEEDLSKYEFEPTTSFEALANEEIKLTLD